MEQLPAPFQIGEQVRFEFAPKMSGIINKIHFARAGSVTYDVDSSYSSLLDGMDVPDNIRFYCMSGRHLLKYAQGEPVNIGQPDIDWNA